MTKNRNIFIATIFQLFLHFRPSNSTQQHQGRVFGGKGAESGQFPWNAAVITEYSNEKTYFCGGSIVTRSWVLTAAHCLATRKGEDPMKVFINRVQVLAGDNQIMRNGEFSVGLDFSLSNPFKNQIRVQDKDKDKGSSQLVQSDKLVVPAKFRSDCKTHDIGLILLAKDLIFNKDVQSINLATPELDVLTARGCNISGWGETENGKISKELRWARVRVVQEAECLEVLKSGFKLTPTRFCAGVWNGGISGCETDSGSGLSCHAPNKGVIPYLFGVHSFLPKEKKCGDEKNPVVYTKVSEYKAWIDCVMAVDVQIDGKDTADKCDQHLKVIKMDRTECDSLSVLVLVLLVFIAVLFTSVIVGSIVFHCRAKRDFEKYQDKQIEQLEKKLSANMVKMQPEVKLENNETVVNEEKPENYENIENVENNEINT